MNAAADQDILDLIESFSEGIEIDGSTKKLTIKQLAFVRCYILNGGNGVQAAKEAGYKGNDKTLSVVASDNLVKPCIAKCLQMHQKLLVKEFIWTAEDKRKSLMEIVAMGTTKIQLPSKKGDEDVHGDRKGDKEEPEPIYAMLDATNAIKAIGEDNKMVGDLAAIKTENSHTMSQEEWLNDLD